MTTYLQEVGFIIDKIGNKYICGRRGLSEDEWNRRVETVYDKVKQSRTRHQYFYALRYLGLLTHDYHFEFPEGGQYNRSRIFTEEDPILPLWVQTWKDGTVYTVKDYTGTIPRNARIVAINGHSTQEMALINRAISPGEELYAMAWMNSQDEPNPRSWTNLPNYLFTEGIKAPFEIEYIDPATDTPQKATLDAMKRGRYLKYTKNRGQAPGEKGEGNPQEARRVSKSGRRNRSADDQYLLGKKLCGIVALQLRTGGSRACSNVL